MTAGRGAALTGRRALVAVGVAVVMAVILAGVIAADAALGERPAVVMVSGVAAAVAGVLTGRAGRWWLYGRGRDGDGDAVGDGREPAGNPALAYAGWVLRGCLEAGAEPAVRTARDDSHAMRVTAVVVAVSLHGWLTGTDLPWAEDSPESRAAGRQAAVLLEVMGLDPAGQDGPDPPVVTWWQVEGLSDLQVRQMLTRTARRAAAMAGPADRIAAAGAARAAVAGLPAAEREDALILPAHVALLIPALALSRMWDGLWPAGMPAPFRCLDSLLHGDRDAPARIPDPPYCQAQAGAGADICGSAFTFTAHDCTDARRGRAARLGLVARLGRVAWLGRVARMGRAGGREVTEFFGYFREPGTVEDDARTDEALTTAVLVVRRRSRLAERARRIATDPTGQPQNRVGEMLRVNVALCPCTSRRRCPALDKASLVKAVDHAYR